MNARMVLLTVALHLALLIPLKCLAGWSGPVRVLSGEWGTGEQQFGVEQASATVWAPILTAVLGNGSVVVSDEINVREKVYSREGSLLKIIPWQIVSAGTKTVNPEYARYRYFDIVGYSKDGGVWIKQDGYMLRSPSGELLASLPKCPPELGLFKRIKSGPRREGLSLIYPDRTYSLPDREYPSHIRDVGGSLHFQQGRTVTRYGACGSEIASLTVPETASERVNGQGIEDVAYGEPLLGPDGNIYATRRSSGGFGVVKWVWQDEPGAAGGPEPPEKLMGASVSLGLYLTWRQSPQDPGCVTGYQLSRASSPGGQYQVLATVAKGVLKYNDVSAEPGKTYSYKVRVVAGQECSVYSNEVTGRRQ